MKYLFMLLFVLIATIHVKAGEIGVEIEKIYKNLNYVNYYSDTLNHNQFKESIFKIGTAAIPYLFEEVNKDKDSLKLFAVAKVLSELYQKPFFEDIAFYYRKYKSKNIECLSIMLLLYIEMKYHSESVNDSAEYSIKKCNFIIPKEIIEIIINGLKYNEFVIQSLFPIHEAETISSISNSLIYFICPELATECVKGNYNKKHLIECATNLYNKNLIIWNKEYCRFTINGK